MLSDLPAQLRLAWRFLLRTPYFTLPAVASLALGIAVNTVSFSVFSAMLLRPLSPHLGDELVRIGRTERGASEFRSLTFDEFLFLREHAASYTELAGHQLETVIMRAGTGARMISGEIVAGNYFATLGVQPQLGRTLDAESSAGFAGDAVVVISDAFWRTHFAAERNVIGRVITLNDYPFTIVGVAPAGFHGTFPGVGVNVWLPAARIDAARPGTHERSLMLLGRLQPGVRQTSARAELDVLAQRLADQNIERDRNRSFALTAARGVHPAFAGMLRLVLSLLLAVVGVVLLIACANVASLLLARASARRAELATRLALGASRAQLLRQLLTESLLLAALGGIAGMLLAIWPLRLLNATSITPGPAGSGLQLDLQLDARVWLFTAVITLLTTLAFGLAPALQATRVNLLAVMQHGRVTGRMRARVRSTLLVLQVALSFLLLVAAGLLFRSVHNAGRLDPGFDPDNVVVASFDLQAAGYDDAGTTAFQQELLRRVRALPNVEHAALADFVPLDDRGGHPLQLSVPEANHIEPRAVNVGRVSDDYFATVRQPVLEGRAFSAQDHVGERGVIVNQAFVRQYWNTTSGVGKHIRLGEEQQDYEIIGVVQDARYGSYGGPVAPLVLLPVSGERRLDLHVRTSLSARVAVSEIARVARAVDTRVPIITRAMREAMAFSLLPARIGRTILATAGVIALLLAAGGLYGMVCFTLEQRLKEVGIRVALGATRRGVFRTVVAGTLRLAVIGVGIGGLLAFGATRLLRAVLYGLSPTDPATFVAITLLLLGTTLAAGYAAARKGLGVDPMLVLRRD